MVPWQLQVLPKSGLQQLQAGRGGSCQWAADLAEGTQTLLVASTAHWVPVDHVSSQTQLLMAAVVSPQTHVLAAGWET